MLSLNDKYEWITQKEVEYSISLFRNIMVIADLQMFPLTSPYAKEN